MFKKVLITDHFYKPNKRDFRWLTSNRMKVSFSGSFFSLKDNDIKYSEIENAFILKYKSFFFFNYNIFGFKYQEKHYQIGINNTEKEFINKKLNVQVAEIKTNVWDILYLIILLALIYLGFII